MLCKVFKSKRDRECTERHCFRSHYAFLFFLNIKYFFLLVCWFLFLFQFKVITLTIQLKLMSSPLRWHEAFGLQFFFSYILFRFNSKKRKLWNAFHMLGLTAPILCVTHQLFKYFQCTVNWNFCFWIFLFLTLCYCSAFSTKEKS